MKKKIVKLMEVADNCKYRYLGFEPWCGQHGLCLARLSLSKQLWSLFLQLHSIQASSPSGFVEVCVGLLVKVCFYIPSGVRKLTVSEKNKKQTRESHVLWNFYLIIRSHVASLKLVDNSCSIRGGPTHFFHSLMARASCMHVYRYCLQEKEKEKEEGQLTQAG